MTRTNPFEELERMFERLGRQFEDASKTWGEGDAFEQWTGGFESMAIDLAERDEAFVVTVDLPGFDQSDVDVEVTDRTLTIDAEHDESRETADAEYLRRERRHEAQQRSIRLPDEIDTEGVDATMSTGVLTVRLPKVAAKSARTIAIE